jgi:pSer/pThr/pTyr-binding forkhead associated (FHA) protein
MKIFLDPLHSGDTTRIIIDPIAHVQVRRVRDQCQISQDNLFFLQKVISRQHAIIYEEDEKIYVKDTKSSGGNLLY